MPRLTKSKNKYKIRLSFYKKKKKTFFFHTSINNKNTCKIFCKMQRLKNCLLFNVSAINPIPTNVLWSVRGCRGEITVPHTPPFLSG